MDSNKNKIGYIYLIENDVNSMVYIGQTARNIDIRYSAHLHMVAHNADTKLYKAMRKIGVEHFRVRELFKCDIKDLNYYEKYYISYYDSYNNGYNSTPGGSSGSQTLDRIDIDLFEQMYNDGVTLVRMAEKFNCSIKTINEIRKILDIDPNRGAFRKGKYAEYNGKYRAIIRYNRDFVPIQEYSTMRQAIEDCNIQGQPYYYIRQACIRGNIAYGFRWQYKDELEFEYENQKCYFNTIFDKQLYDSGKHSIYKNSYGLYTVEGIDYSVITGNKSHDDKKCEVSSDDRSERINSIRNSIESGKNLSEIGRELGVSANAIKKCCIKYGIDYNKQENLVRSMYFIIRNPKTNDTAIMNAVSANELFNNTGLSRNESIYSTFNDLKLAVENNKAYLGLSVQTAGENAVLNIPESFINSITMKDKICFDKNGERLIFNGWDEVCDYIIDNNISKSNRRSIRSMIRQSIKERAGYRFGGTWSIVK